MTLEPFDDRTLDRLEFPKVLEMLAGYAAADPTRDRIRAIRPTADREEIAKRRDLLAEALRLENADVLFRVEAFPEVGKILRRLAPEDAVITGEEFRELQLVLQSARRVRSAIDAVETEISRIRKLAGGLRPPGELLLELDRCIGETGEILDRASAELSAVRRSIRRTEEELQDRLRKIINAPHASDFLQDRFVTTRNGRYVIPVRAEAARQVRGVIHDRSDTGRTVFLEPMETLPLGNRLNDLASQERVEIRRVLQRLSRLARDRIAELRDTFEALVRCDRLQALARFAAAHEMTPPVMNRDPAFLRLRGARHLVLERTLAVEGRPGDLVPLDLEIGGPRRVLLVSGSNTGGKTVALKTAGLLVAMAQAGLPVPASEESRFGIFRGIYVEIGDEQSIEQSLSTFSAHVAQIVSILEAAGPDSLVILDELGAGTDPAEGGALACAILAGLKERGAVTIASTHLGQPKGFVHRTDGMENAAVTFDPESLQPTYRLEIGRPGSSHALAVSARLGVPGDVMRTARRFLESDEARLETLLADLNAERERLLAQLREAESARREAAGEREAVQREMRELRKRRKEILRKAYREAGAIVERTRRQMDEAIREARRAAGTTPEGVRRARRRVERKREGMARAREQVRERPARPLPWEEIREGREIWVASLRSVGTVESLDPRRRRVRVALGNLRVDVPADEIQASPETPAGPPSPGTAPGYSVRAATPVPMELVLIGRRVEPALSELDRYLNEAVVARLPEVRIVHGLGTGALRSAVHEELRTHPLVEDFRLCPPEQGGFGATVVRLRL